MQYKRKDYDPKKHSLLPALTVKQPYASMISSGRKTIEVRSKRTSFRGELIITASGGRDKGVSSELPTGCTICRVELFAIKPIKLFTSKDFEATGVPKHLWKHLKGYGWMLRDPKPLIEYPVMGQLGVWNLVVDSNDIIEYPTNKAILMPKTQRLALYYFRILIYGFIAISILGILFLMYRLTF